MRNLPQNIQHTSRGFVLSCARSQYICFQKWICLGQHLFQDGGMVFIQIDEVGFYRHKIWYSYFLFTQRVVSWELLVSPPWFTDYFFISISFHNIYKGPVGIGLKKVFAPLLFLKKSPCPFKRKTLSPCFLISSQNSLT